jgi:EmrB/QacA subfamily drug resistance transporter
MEVTNARRWLALGALSLATLVIGLDMTVLTVALPTLAVDLHANTSSLQWFTTSYTLALAALIVPAGVLADRYGRKKFLLAALLLFGVASVWCAYSRSCGELIGARTLLGVAAAVVMPLGMGVLPSLFPDSEQRTRAITVMVTAMGLGMPLGPLVGGYLLNNFWWGSAFLVSVPFVVLGSVAVAVLLPESRSDTAFTVDLPGVALSSIGMVGLTYGFTRLGAQGWGDNIAWGAVLAAVAAFSVFLLWQRRVAARGGHPLIDLGLFGKPAYAWGAIALTLANFGLFGMFFATPQYFQAVLGADALGSGVRLLPMIGGMVLGARLLPKVLRRAGARGALLVGFVLLAAGLGLGSLTTAHSGYGQAAVWLVLLGLGMGAVMPASMDMALGALEPRRAAAGTALLQAIRQAGGSIGVAVLGTIEATRYHARLGAFNVEPIRESVNIGVAAARKLRDPAMLERVQSAFTSGMDLMYLICAGTSLATLVLVAIFLPRRLRSGEKSEQARAGAAQSVHVG